MSIWEIFVVAVSLAMDALAVSTSNGLALKNANFKHATVFGLYFGGFQFGMPVIGYFCGKWFSVYIEAIDHWIAFALLGIIGGKMLWDSFHADDEETAESTEEKIMAPANMIMLAVATSIDALAVGISIALAEGTNIWVSAAVIGAVAFALSFLGVLAGKRIGDKFRAYATRVGGLVLIIIGVRILISHIFFG